MQMTDAMDAWVRMTMLTPNGPVAREAVVVMSRSKPVAVLQPIRLLRRADTELKKSDPSFILVRIVVNRETMVLLLAAPSQRCAMVNGYSGYKAEMTRWSSHVGAAACTQRWAAASQDRRMLTLVRRASSQAAASAAPVPATAAFRLGSDIIVVHPRAGAL